MSTDHSSARRRRALGGALAGLVCGGALGAAHALSSSDKPLWLSVAVFAMAVGIPLAATAAMFSTHREELAAAAAEGELSIERRWADRAAANAFWSLVTMLFILWMVSTVFHAAWASALHPLWVVGAAIALDLVFYVIQHHKES